MEISGLLEILDNICPFSLSVDGDRYGLMVGNETAEVNKIYITLDADEIALQKAVQNGCDTVISHHPFIYNPLFSVSGIVYDYIKSGLNVISVHTCLDCARDGVADTFAKTLGLTDIIEIEIENRPLARMGYAAGDITANVKSDCIRCVKNLPVNKVLSVCGSGGSYVALAKSLGCDTLITGEAKHEHYVAAVNEGINLITVGHFESENPAMAVLCEKLSDRFDCVLSDRTELTVRR